MPRDRTEPFKRTDRIVRAMRLMHAIWKTPGGLTPGDAATILGVSTRTAYRDLRVLRHDLKLEMERRGNHWCLTSTAFMPPMPMSVLEAVHLFISMRLLDRFLDRGGDGHIASAMQKVAAAMPAEIAGRVYPLVPRLRDRPRDFRAEKIFDAVALGWAQSRKVRIGYPSRADGEPTIKYRDFAPYTLEPNPFGHGSYAIGLDDASGQIRCFKIERIHSATLTETPFAIPKEFDPLERFDRAWLVSDEVPVEIRLRFHDREAAARARETHWHPSQRIEDGPDGTLDLLLLVSGVTEILNWILGWGSAVEVIEPADLRAQVATAARGMAARYGG